MRECCSSRRVDSNDSHNAMSVAQIRCRSSVDLGTMRSYLATKEGEAVMGQVINWTSNARGRTEDGEHTKLFGKLHPRGPSPITR